MPILQLILFLMLNINYMKTSDNKYSGINKDEFKLLPLHEFQEMTAAQFKVLPLNLISLITKEKFAALPSNMIQLMTKKQCRSLSKDIIEGINYKQALQLSVDQILNLKDNFNDELSKQILQRNHDNLSEHQLALLSNISLLDNYKNNQLTKEKKINTINIFNIKNHMIFFSLINTSIYITSKIFLKYKINCHCGN